MLVTVCPVRERIPVYPVRERIPVYLVRISREGKNAQVRLTNGSYIGFRNKALGQQGAESARVRKSCR